MKKWLICGAWLSLAACGGNRDTISQSDLQKALETSPVSGQVCVPFALEVGDTLPHNAPQLSLGAPEIRFLSRLPNGKRANERAAKQMAILADADIYEDVGITKDGSGDHALRYYTYRLGKKGGQAFRQTPHGALLCIGKLDVKKINYYTTPSPANGLITTQVSFEATIKPERWAKKLLKNSPYYEGLSQTETHQTTLVKTNQGWRDIDSLH